MTILLLLIGAYYSDLDYSFQQNVNESRFVLIKNSSLVYNDFESSPKKLVFFDLATGKKNGEIYMADDYWIGNYAYLSIPNWLGLNCLKRSPQGGLIRRVMFYDLEKKQFYTGLDERSDPDDPFNVFYRQFITSGDRIFVNIWKRKGLYSNETRTLQEIGLNLVYEKNQKTSHVEIQYLGSPFLQVYAPENLVSSNVKTKFVVTNPENNAQVFVIEELGLRIWEFGTVDDPTMDKDLDIKGYYELGLSNWIKPDLRKSEEEGFFSSFSRVVGAFAEESGVLVGYRSPGLDGNSDLILQRFDYSGKMVGGIVSLGNALIVGPADDKGLYWIGKQNGGKIELVKREL